MQYRNLDFSTQVLLVSLVLVLIGSVLLRVGVVLKRKLARVPRLYPRTWTTRQCKLMDRFCIAIGIVLSALWLELLIATPRMPTNWPIGFLEATFTVALLLLTNAWLILLLPRDWSVLGSLTKQFFATLFLLATWWTLMIGGTAWMIAKASFAPPPSLIFGPVIA